MSSEHHAVKPKDLNRIDSRHLGELLWWSYNLNVSLEKLLTVIDEVGESAEIVKGQLKDCSKVE
jgi:Protein of unknown function (DUF3606)